MGNRSEETQMLLLLKRRFNFCVTMFILSTLLAAFMALIAAPWLCLGAVLLAVAAYSRALKLAKVLRIYLEANDIRILEGQFQGVSPDDLEVLSAGFGLATVFIVVATMNTLIPPITGVVAGSSCVIISLVLHGGAEKKNKKAQKAKPADDKGV